MLAGERRLRMLEQVAERQVVSVSELAGRFGVSEMTIRRDIRRLERDGFLRQSYGGGDCACHAFARAGDQCPRLAVCN